MCARYYIGDNEELGAMVAAMERSPLQSLIPPDAPVARSGEVAPGCVVPARAVTRTGRPAVFPMRWGFKGRSLLINARSETAAAKPTFSGAFRSHRCVLPACGYFEWEHVTDSAGRKRTGDKYLIRPRDARVTWLCGLYRPENGIPSFVILTREPGESVRFIHDRMPLIPPDEAVRCWIDPKEDPVPLLGLALTDMAYERVS